MTAKEAAEFIVARWRLEHPPEAIMMALLLQGVSLKRSQIRAVIRRYIDRKTENRHPAAGVIPRV